MTWRAFAAAAVFVAMLVAAVLLMRPTQPPAAETARPTPEVREVPVLPGRQPPLTRSDLIAAAARTADAYAQGQAAPPEFADLAGRRFTLRLSFGCDGPGSEEEGAWAFWSYDAEQETLRATVTPEVWTDADFVKASATATEFEAAEGFWLSRPWMSVGECPVRPGRLGREDAAQASSTQEIPGQESNAASEPNAETAAAPVRQTLAIVEFFEPGSRRTARRNGRPYRLVTEVPAAEIDLRNGLRLVLEGRLAALGNGQPIVCRSERTNERPLCIISVDIGRIAISDASGERTFAEWAD